MKRFSTASESLNQSTAKGDYSERYFLMKNCHEESEEIPKCDTKTKFSPTSERNGLLPERSTRKYDFNRRYSCMRNFNDERLLASDDDHPEYLPKDNAKIQFSPTLDRNGYEKNNEIGSYSEKHSFKKSFHDDRSSASDDDIPEDLPVCEYSTESSFDSPYKGENKESTCQSQSCISNEEETDLTPDLKVDSKPFKQEHDANPPASYQKIQTEFPNSTEHRTLQQEKTFEEKHDVKMENLKIRENLSTEITIPVRQRHTLSVLTIVSRDSRTSPETKNISPTSNITEPRVALKKLKEQLDKNEENEALENFRQYNENVEDENDEIMIIKDLKLEKGTQSYTVPEVIDLTNEENVTKENEVEVMQNLNVNDEKKEVKNFAIKKEPVESKSIKLERQEENLEIPPEKCSKKKHRRCFHIKKKDSQNCKRTRCQIM